MKFKNVSVKKWFWNTYYSREGLIKLFENTPTIRNFDKNNDIPIIDVIEDHYASDKGIKTTQNRLLIIADNNEFP